MTFPPPSALGAPARFSSWRPGQDDAMLDADRSPTRFMIQIMPTGSGKSLVYMVLALLGTGRTCILTRTKALQAQLMADFGESGLVDVRGSNAYPCDAVEPGGELASYRRRGGVSCEEGPCHYGVRCRLRSAGCQYYDALRRATGAQLVVTNYSYWMTINRHRPPGLRTVTHGVVGPGFDTLILDEAHSAPDALGEFLTVELTPWDARTIGATLLPADTEPERWQEWGREQATHVEGLCQELEEEAKEALDHGSSLEPAERRRLRALRRVLTTLKVIATVDATWICCRRGRAAMFAPIWPAPYAERALFLGIPRVILLSATAGRKTASYLGIAPADLTVHEYPSRFPIERRLTLIVPSIRLNHRTPDSQLQIWLSRILIIVRARDGRNGIIQSVSYDRAARIAEYLAATLEDPSRILTHTSGTAIETIARYREADPASGSILISPSVSTGYDFPYDLCRYQIIAKVPFPNSVDPVLRARMAHDAEYGPYLTMQTLEQSVGRGMRHADDLCEVFVVDDNCRWFLRQYRPFAAEWFLDGIRTVRGIPPAPAV